MKLIADLHTHTVASTHAFSTLHEMVEQAKQNGLAALAVTDHAYGMPDAPHPWYFSNLLHLPNILPGGFLLLKGAEANGMDASGRLDMDEWILRKLDWVIVSLHRNLIERLTYEEATRFWLAVAQNPHVDMIGHSEQAEYLYDYDRVTKAFAANNKVVELNANSASVRPGNEENMRNLALCCKKNGTRVAVNSDAHSVYALGNTGAVVHMLEEMDFPEKLVVNAGMPQLLAELKAHGRAVAANVEGLL